MNDFRDIIALWDRQADLASDAGVARCTVAGWKLRNTIPSMYFAKMVESAKARRIKGVTFQTLFALAERAQ